MSMNSQSPIDPVCGMSVNPQTAGSLHWQGRGGGACQLRRWSSQPKAQQRQPHPLAGGA